jgi:hypothetical protein
MAQDLFGDEVQTRSFEADAMGFLIAYVKRTGGQPFSAEDVTTSALIAGVAPDDLRAWGTVFSQAARDGYIRRSDVVFKRSMGNGAPTLGWVGAR